MLVLFEKRLVQVLQRHKILGRRGLVTPESEYSWQIAVTPILRGSPLSIYGLGHPSCARWWKDKICELVISSAIESVSWEGPPAGGQTTAFQGSPHPVRHIRITGLPSSSYQNWSPLLFYGRSKDSL